MAKNSIHYSLMLFSEKPWYFSVVVDATLPFVVAGCCDYSVGLVWDLACLSGYERFLM
jgi:hypothetical protein